MDPKLIGGLTCFAQHDLAMHGWGWAGCWGVTMGWALSRQCLISLSAIAIDGSAEAAASQAVACNVSLSSLHECVLSVGVPF